MKIFSLLFVFILLSHIIQGQSLIQSDKSGESSILLNSGGQIQFNAAATKIEGTFNLITATDRIKQHIFSVGFTATDKLVNIANLDKFKANVDFNYVFGFNQVGNMKLPLWVYISPYARIVNYNTAYLNNDVKEIKNFNYGVKVHANKLFIMNESELLIGIAVGFSPKGSNSALFEKVSFNSPINTTPSGVLLYKQKSAIYGPNPEYTDGWEIPFDLLFYPGGWLAEKARLGFGLSKRYYHNNNLQQLNTSIGFFHYGYSKATTGELIIPSGNNPEKVVFGFFVQYSDVFNQFEVTRTKSFNERLNFILSVGIPLNY